MTTPHDISIAYTPDSDDAFYYHALECGHLPSDSFRMAFHTDHIINLNRAARVRRYDITAISSVAYPRLARDYRVLSVGTSVGRGYGPVLVSRQKCTLEQLSHKRIGVPGMPTTGGFLMKWVQPQAELVEMQFDKIAGAVAAGELDAGVMIHEELLFYPRLGLQKIADLGATWSRHTGLPLPVGLNVVRREIGLETSQILCDLIRESLLWALDHRDEALGWTQQFGRGKAGGVGDQFVSMFANADSIVLPDDARTALGVLLKQVKEVGMADSIPEVEFVDGSPEVTATLSKRIAA